MIPSCIRAGGLNNEACLNFSPAINSGPFMNCVPVTNYPPANFGPVTDRQKAMHMSPLCIHTGVLINEKIKVAVSVDKQRILYGKIYFRTKVNK